METIRPTATSVLWNGAVAVHCYGARHGDWAIKSWESDDADALNPGIAGRIERVARDRGAGRLYLPSPNRFDGEIVGSEALTVAWPGGRIFRGAYAEGVTLGKISDACGIASSDCPTIVARSPSTLLAAAAHAGRESLYDAKALFDGAPPRPHASVTDSIVEALGRDIDVFVACGIGPSDFLHPTDDPKHGARNAAMIRHLRETWGPSCASDGRDGRIDLVELIRLQFEALGVPRSRVAHDGIDTFGDASIDGKPLWHSHRRDKGGKRNFILVIRRS